MKLQLTLEVEVVEGTVSDQQVINTIASTFMCGQMEVLNESENQIGNIVCVVESIVRV